jgi:hypothetical protein
MQQHADVVTDLKGNVIKGASVRVLLLDGTLATIYAANGGAPTGNPLISGQQGEFAFYAPNGDYLLEITAGGKALTTTGPVKLYDVLDDGDAARWSSLAQGDGADKIGFSRRTVHDKLLERRSVEDHWLAVEEDDAPAIQRAVDALDGKPGTIEFTRRTYKIKSKVSCVAGQNFIGNGATLDVSEYDGIFLSYNEADIFSLSDPAQGAFHPPTLIEGFKVMGKVSVPAPNRNFVFAKINRTPYVTMRDCTLYYAAAAHIIDESILCTFDSVRCYNPVADCFWFNCTDRVARFAPNGCTIINCWLEEQKFPCNGVRISAGHVAIAGGYMESLSTLVKIDGGIATISGVQMGLRYQANSIGVQVTQPTTLQMSGCDITLAGGLNAAATTALSIGADTTLTFNDNLITAIHGSTEASSCFAVNGAVIGTMNGNTILSKVLGGKTTVFDVGNNAAYTYRGTFEGNHLEAQAGCGMDFNKANSGAGKLAATVQGRFVRVGSFAQLTTSVIHGSTFDGAGSVLALGGGIVRDNAFLSVGWSVTGAALEENNFGLYALGKQSKPMASYSLGALTAIANDTYTKVLFNTKDYDTNDAYSTGTGRFQPNVPGYYHITALLAWYPSTVGVVQSYIYKNGASYKAGANNPNNANGFSQRVDGYVYLNGTTDYVEIFVRQTSGANLNLANGSANTYLQAAFVRSA